MIRLNRIFLKNFLSHAESRVTLNDGDRILIDGPSGSGKSAIIDGVIWGLYGVGRVDNRSLIRASEDQATVVIEVSDTDTQKCYRIVRTVNKKGKQTLEVFEGTVVDSAVNKPIAQTGTREIQEWIERDLLHASYELFINSVAYPQDRKDSFALATSVRRKELLMEILSVADIDDYYDRTVELLKKEELHCAELEGELRLLTDHLVKLETAGLDLNELTAQVDRLDAEIAMVSKELSDGRERRVLLQEEVKKSYGLASDQMHINMKMENFRQKETDITARLTAAQTITGNEYTGAKKMIQELDKQLAESKPNELLRAQLLQTRPEEKGYALRITELETDLEHLKNDTPLCPSGDDCPYFQRLKPQQDELVERISALKAERDQFHTDLDSWRKEIDALPDPIDFDEINMGRSRLAEMVALYESIPDEEKALKATKKEIAELETAHLEIVKELDGMADHNTEIAELDELIRDAEGTVLQDTSLLATARAKLGMAQDATKQLEETHKQHVEVQTDIASSMDKIRQFDLLRQAFGTNGIRAIAADHLIPQLEEKINEILAQMSDFRIRLDTQKKSAKESTIEGLFITIQNDQGQVFDFNSYSGGEKLKITVAISEALASLQKVDFRLVDELFIGLDESSAESFAHVLAQIQGRFSQMLCISHIPLIKETLDKKLIVRKNDGISVIE